MAIDQRLNDLENGAADLEAKIVGGLELKLQELQRRADQLAAKLVGSIESRLGVMDAQAIKIGRKILKRVDDRLGNAYQGVFKYGGRYPTAEDAYYGLKSGDLLTSMGITDDQVQPVAVGSDSSPVVPAPDEPEETAPFPPAPASVPEGPSYQKPPAPPEPAPPGPHPRVEWQPGLYPYPGVDFGPTCLAQQATWGWMENPGVQWWPLNWGIGGPAVYDNNNVVPVVMLHEGEPCPYGSEGHCLDGCAFGQRPGTAHVQVCIPPGTQILINPATGQMVAAAINTTLLSQGWVYAYRGDCSTPQIFPQPSQPTGQPPTQPPTTPPACEPCKAVCPEPPKLDCKPGAQPKPVNIPAGGNLDICKVLDEIAHAFSLKDVKLSDFFKVAAGQVCLTPSVVNVLNAIIGSDEQVLPGLVRRFTAWAELIIKNFANGVDCDRAALTPIAIHNAAVEVINRYFPIIPPQYIDMARQVAYTACQSKMPTGRDADSAYLADRIDSKEWECWHKAAGDLLGPAQKVMETNRARLTPAQAVVAWRRGIIDDARLAKLVRQGGLIEEDDRSELKDMQLWYPSGTELIRWMAKDVGDPDTRKEFRLEEEFDQKFQGKMKEWADGAGISREFLLNAWVAHWQNVGTTVHFNALHRLRPDVAPANLVTTKEAVRRSLLQQDYPPYWVDRMIALSYKVITRIDARRMYQLHTIDEQRLSGIFQDEGYGQKDADDLAEFYKRQREVAEAKASGLPTMRTLIMQYARGEVTGQDMRDVLQKITISDDQYDEAVQSAELARDTYIRATAIKGIRRQFVTGLIDEGDATYALSQVGVDSDEVDNLLFLWRIDRQKRGKVPSAAQLCKWRYLNLITPIQQAAALVRVGWSAPDASRIVKECDYEVARKREADQERAERAAEKEAKKQEAANKAAGRTRRNGQPAASPAS